MLSQNPLRVRCRKVGEPGVTSPSPRALLSNTHKWGRGASVSDLPAEGEIRQPAQAAPRVGRARRRRRVPGTRPAARSRAPPVRSVVVGPGAPHPDGSRRTTPARRRPARRRCRDVGLAPRQIGQPQQPPGHDGIDGHRSVDPLRRPHRQRLDLAALLEHVVIALAEPPLGLAAHAGEGGLGRLHPPRGQQQPADGGLPGGWRGLLGQDHHGRDGRQRRPAPLMARRQEGHRGEAQRQPGLPGRAVGADAPPPPGRHR